MIKFSQSNKGDTLFWEHCQRLRIRQLDYQLSMNRIGSFFLFIGFLLIGLYLLSDIAGSAVFGLLIAGGITLSIGILAKWRSPKEEHEGSSRFRLIRDIRNRPRLTRQEKKEERKKIKE